MKMWLRAAVCVAALCLAVVLAISVHKANRNPNSVFAKSLFRVKGVRFLPVLSFVYLFYAAVAIFFGLQIVDQTDELDVYFLEEKVISIMNFVKYGHMSYEEFGASRYPLVAVQGGGPIPSKEKPRILVLGDSFVWGYGLSNMNQIWWNIMAAELERRGYDCEVYAVGFVKTSTYDELVWLKDTTVLEDIQPDIIIIGYVTNDPDLESLGMGFRYYLPSPFSSSARRVFSSLFPNLSRQVDSMWMVKCSQTENPHNNAEYGYTVLTWLEKLVEEGNLEKYNAYVVEPLGEFARALGVPLLIIPTPNQPTIANFESHYKSVLPLFEQAGLPVYNPLALFAGQYSDTKYADYYHASPVDSHPGPATSLFLGQYAADVLEQEYGSIMTKSGSEGGQSAHLIEINDWMPYEVRPQPIKESAGASQYAIAYPGRPSDFLRLPLKKGYIKLNFKYPVRISSVRIDGEDLLSAEMYTLAINGALGFDDQKPVSLGERRGTQCVWEDGSGRYVTSLLISAKTKDEAPAYLSIRIESQGGEGAFY